VGRTLTALESAGYRGELTDPTWLAKAFFQGQFIDIIFHSWNQLARVDKAWFRHARPARILNTPILLCPPEEMIWQKSFVMSRDRYDGADVARLLRAFHHELQWSRLLERFGIHWPVLLSHLVLFQYVFPDEHSDGLDAALDDLTSRLQSGQIAETAARVSRGVFLSREHASLVPGVRESRRPRGG
jgi:hypothetical protein